MSIDQSELAVMVRALLGGMNALRLEIRAASASSFDAWDGGAAEWQDSDKYMADAQQDIKDCLWRLERAS